MDIERTNMLTLDDVISYFEYKIGIVALMSAVRKKQIPSIEIEGKTYILKDDLEKVYEQPFDHDKRITNYFLTPKEALACFEGSISESVLYRMIWSGRIPSKRVGSKYVILRDKLEKLLHKKIKVHHE